MADGEFVRAPLVGELAAFPPPPLVRGWTGRRPAELREGGCRGRGVAAPGQRAQRPLGGLAGQCCEEREAPQAPANGRVYFSVTVEYFQVVKSSICLTFFLWNLDSKRICR